MDATSKIKDAHTERRKNWITAGLVMGFVVGVATAGLLIWYWQKPSIMAEADNPLGLAVVQVIDEGFIGSLFFPDGIYRFKYQHKIDGTESERTVRLRKNTAKTASVKWIDMKAYGFLNGYLELVWDLDRWRVPTGEERARGK